MHKFVPELFFSGIMIHQKIDDWHHRINRVTTAFEDIAGPLDAHDLNWKPNPQTWSIAQVMDHLITLNKTFWPILDQLEAGTYQAGFMARLPFMANFIGGFILKSVLPRYQTKNAYLSHLGA